MRSDHPKLLTVLDPTSLLGREVTEKVARAVPEVRRRLFHTSEEPEHLIAEVAGEAVLVPPLADPDEIEGSAAVLVTTLPPPATCDRLLAWLRAHPDVALLDCTQPGIAGGDALCVADALPAGKPPLPWYHLADPALAAPLRVLGALGAFGPRVLHLTVACPVAPLGSDALDELASQGALRLSGHPMRGLGRLPAVLAFDLAPAGAERSARLESQLAELHPRLESRVHAVDAGVFHGYLATIVVRCETVPSSERVRSAVRDAGGLRLARRNEVVTTTDAVERGSIVCGDLQARQGWVSAWLLSDGLAVGAVAAVPELLRDLTAG